MWSDIDQHRSYRIYIQDDVDIFHLLLAFDWVIWDLLVTQYAPAMDKGFI